MCLSKSIIVLISKRIHILKIGKPLESIHYTECPISSFQMYKNHLKIAGLQAHIDRLFSNSQNVCFVMIIKIYTK